MTQVLKDKRNYCLIKRVSSDATPSEYCHKYNRGMLMFNFSVVKLHDNTMNDHKKLPHA